MQTRSRPFVRAGLAVALVASAAALAARARSSPAPLEREFRAEYPRTAVHGAELAGVALDKLVVEGLHLVEREDRTVEDGGVVLSFADANGHVRVVVTVAVAASEEAARRFVDVVLHAVQVTLPPAVDPAMGDYAFADDAGRGEALVIAAAGNVAWTVRVDRETLSLPRAAEVVATLRTLAVAGAPKFPTVALSLPSDVRLAGAPVAIATNAKATLRAEGAYIAHGKTAPLVRPLAPGPIAVVATVVDELGRVSSARAEATAR